MDKMEKIINDNAYTIKVLCNFFKNDSVIEQYNNLAFLHTSLKTLDHSDFTMWGNIKSLGNLKAKYSPKRRVPWSKVISERVGDYILYNPKFFNKIKVNEIIGNDAHEKCHMLNYNHDYYHNNDRKFSVPYFVGYFFEYWSQDDKINIIIGKDYSYETTYNIIKETFYYIKQNKN